MLNKEFGGSVMKKDIREDGVFKINVETSSLIFRYGWYTYTVVEQHAKKVVSNSPGLVDFAIGLVNSVVNLPSGQVRFF